MLIVCAGIYKSASSFAYQIVDGLVRSAGLTHNVSSDHPQFAQGNFVGALNNTKITEMEADVPIGKMRAVKTHDGMPSCCGPLIEAGRLKSIITLRDPRDCALASKALGEHEAKMENGRPILTQLKTLEDAAGLIADSYKRQIKWIQHPNTLIVPFSFLTKHPQKCSIAIAEHLGIPHDPSVTDNLTSDLRKNVREFFGGSGDRWQNELSEEDQKVITEALSHQISIFTKFKNRQIF